MTARERAFKACHKWEMNEVGDDGLEVTVEKAIEAAILEERDACIRDVQGALVDAGTDCPHEALKWAVLRIEKRGQS
jgi:hypothetical protein